MLLGYDHLAASPPLTSLLPTQSRWGAVSQLKHTQCSADRQRRPYFNPPPSHLLPVSTSSPHDLCLFFFIVLPGALPDPRIKLPNLTKPLGDGTEIRVGGKACAHNVEKEMAYPSLWKRAHFPVAATWMKVVFLIYGSQIQASLAEFSGPAHWQRNR